MSDGHGSEMSKRAREVRDRKKNRNSIFDQDKNELPRNYPKKLKIKPASFEQQKKITNKIKHLAESEQDRLFFIGVLVFVLFFILLLIVVF